VAISLVSRSLEPPTLGVVSDGERKERSSAGAPLRTILLLPLGSPSDDSLILLPQVRGEALSTSFEATPSSLRWSTSPSAAPLTLLLAFSSANFIPTCGALGEED
jgi:hypothetical protein